MKIQKDMVPQRIIIKNGGKIGPGQKVVIKASKRNSFFEKAEKKLGSGVVVSIGDTVQISTKQLGTLNSKKGRKKLIGSNDLVYRINTISGLSPDSIITVSPIDE